MKIKEEPKKKQGVGGVSFIVAGIVVMLVPAIFYIMFGDFASLLKSCAVPFSTVDVGNGMIVNCVELRFVYVLSYFCILLGLILVVLGITKKIMEQKKSLKNP